MRLEKALLFTKRKKSEFIKFRYSREATHQKFQIGIIVSIAIQGVEPKTPQTIAPLPQNISKKI